MAHLRSSLPATPQLSCELCRERKVKCDKLEPCTTCVSSGVVCVPIYRQRLPRGRHAPRNNGSKYQATQPQVQQPPQERAAHPQLQATLLNAESGTWEAHDALGPNPVAQVRHNDTQGRKTGDTLPSAYESMSDGGNLVRQRETSVIDFEIG